MNNKIYTKNVEALKKKQPDFWEKLEKLEHREKNKQLKVFSRRAKNGKEATIVCLDGNEYYLSGQYAPEQMAQREAKKINKIDMGAVIFVIGISDGRVIGALQERMKKGAALLVYEPSIEIFLHTIKHYDISKFFEEKYTYLVVEEINGEKLREALETEIAIETIAKLEVLIQGNYNILFGEKVKFALKMLKYGIGQFRLNWNTLRYFEDISIYNITQNYKYLDKHYSINSLQNILPKEIPVIVVAAGPSLNKNIEYLKEAKGKACIIACDTALKPLIRYGIVPDFFVVVDPRKPLELFDDEKIKKIPMISGLDIPPGIMQQHKGKKILYNDSSLTVDLFEYVFKADSSKRSMAGLETGGCVANSAFAAGKWMGAKSIILVGQDLAFTSKKFHAEGTFQKDWEIDLTDPKYSLVEGIDGTMLPTITSFLFFKKWFEHQIEKNKELTVIDATEGGALIHGSKVMTLKEAVASYCQSEFYMEEKWNKIEPHFTEEERMRSIEFKKKMPERIHKLEKEIEKGKKYYMKLKKHTSSKLKYDKELTKIFRKIKAVNQFFEEDGIANLLSVGSRSEEYEIRKIAYQFEEDERKNLHQSAEMGLAFLNRMEEILKEVKPELKKLSEEA